MDKLTRSLQAALGEAQSLAIGRDHPFIEPLHLLKAHDGPPRALPRVPCCWQRALRWSPCRSRWMTHWVRWRRFRAMKTFTSVRKHSGC